MLDQDRVLGTIPVDHGLTVENQLVKNQQVAGADLIVESIVPNQPEATTVGPTMAGRIATARYQPLIVDGLPESPECGRLGKYFDLSVILPCSMCKQQLEEVNRWSIEHLLPFGIS